MKERIKKIELTTSKGDFVVVDYNYNTHRQDLYSLDIDILQRVGYINNITEVDAKLIVDEPERFFNPTNPYCVDDIVFTNYSGGGKLWSALSSLHSLLTSKGIDINNGNWYLFKKLK